VFCSKVVIKKTWNTPSDGSEKKFTDKFRVYRKILKLKVNIKFTDIIKECQICLPHNFPQTSFQIRLATLSQTRITQQIFSQNNEITHDAARPLKYQLFKKSLILNLFLTKSNPILVIKNFTFSKLLLSGDVETNPGPRPTLSINTYNARGLKNRLKLKRFLNSCHKLINENDCAIIFVQETHLELEDSKTLELMWRHKFLLSPGTNRQCGCLTLYDSTWETIESEIDGGGRFGLTVLKKFEAFFIFTNVYAPNDHDPNFFAQVFNRLIEVQSRYPESKIVLGGDFNLVLDENDAINRISSGAELQSRNLFKRNISRLNLKDSYRIINRSGGFTWSRGNCMSRLDMIFVSQEICENISSSIIDWAFDDSDHARLNSKFQIQIAFPKGPGLVRINADLLDDSGSLDVVKAELDELINQIPAHWDPHKKLDFVKMSIRSVITTVTGKQKRNENFEKQALDEQLNLLKTTKERLESGILLCPGLLTDVDRSIAELEAEHKIYLDKVAKKLCLRAQVKWYEDGERSNKYFLNIIKRRSEQKLITRLTVGQDVVESQEEIMHHVTNFYKNLYDDKETNDNYNVLLSDLPKLNEVERRSIDADITLEELKQVLDECNESAPGPDGISYKVYKKLWTSVGTYLLDAWKYSKSIGILPLDQRVSAITLLPKVGKPQDKIENWRPITLSNCDLKIFTKLISNRVSKILDRVIHPCQTAYVPGRIVHDNMRMFEFYNNYCKENNVDALLISLDAKKAFDSVSHKYLHKVLAAYGFSEDFIETVKLLYRDIKANILVNGYKSVLIDILRSVKQGDALSCALFILCIDPLIRKIQNNPDIKSVQVPRSRLTNIKIENKVGGFADDIGIVINNDNESIKNVFLDYDLFSNLSGIELNLDKTEILKMNVNTLHSDFEPEIITVGTTNINTVESITICGICFSNNANIAYDKNILDKIVKMEQQLIRWLQRPLSVEGKILITKTFGLSQLIFSLQMCDIRLAELTEIERIIFKFLWNKKWVGTTAPDRIKRSILKLSYLKGGLSAPDINATNDALKVKQFLRAMATKHPISLIQRYQLERIGYDDYFKCEYAKICLFDPVIKTYQLICNKLTDHFRLHGSSLPLDDPANLCRVPDVIASTDILEYLMRKKEIMIINRFGPLANLGVSNYKQLLNEASYPRNNELGRLASYILTFFPLAWRSAVSATVDVDCDITYEEEFPSHSLQLIKHSNITVKNVKLTLSELMIHHTFPFREYGKFQLEDVDNINPFKNLRKFLHTPRDRFFKYRILQGDIFCNERMYRFKMTNSNLCNHCSARGEVETVKHMLWDCPRAKNLWTFLENLVRQGYNLASYINYNTIILGAAKPIPLIENLILIALKLIMTVDRSNEVDIELYKNKIRNFYIIEKHHFMSCYEKFKTRWSKMEHLLFDTI